MLIWFWFGHPTDESCGLSTGLINEGLHRSGDKVQLELKAGGA